MKDQDPDYTYREENGNSLAGRRPGVEAYTKREAFLAGQAAKSPRIETLII